MAALIGQLLPLSDAESEVMASLADQKLSNWNGIEVGRLRAVASLNISAAAR